MLNGFFGQQCRFQFGGLAQNGGRQQRAARRKLAAKPRMGLGQFHQQLRGAEFPQPEFHPRGMRPAAILKVVRFDQSPDHRPVFVVLGFLRLHQVGQQKRIASCSVRQFDDGAPPPELGERIQPAHFGLSCSFQKRKGLKNRTIEEEEEGFGFWIRGVAEVIDVAIRAQAADDGGARRRICALALGAGGDFAAGADADAGLLTPDKGPSRTGRDRMQAGAFFGEGLFPGGVRGGAEFAMDFVLVDVGEELVEPAVGPFEFAEVIGRQQRWQTFLPVVVAAFDFAFGLRRGRVAEGDAVEVQGCAEPGEGVGVEFVKACVRQSEFTGRRVPGAFIPSMAGDQVTKEERGESFD